MSDQSARDKFLPMLSPYVDGELSPEERQLLEQHLSTNKELAAMVADLRAGDALIRHAFEMQGDGEDWKAFTDGVMSKVVPQKLPLLERLKLSLSEMFTYQRGPMLAGFAGAAAAMVIGFGALSLGLGTPQGYGATRMEVKTVSSSENPDIKPLVVETDTGDAIIWVVESNNPDGGKKKKDGEHSEETLTGDPEGNQGDL